MRAPKTIRESNADIAAIRQLAERVLCTLGRTSKTIRALAFKTLFLCAELEELREKVT